MPPPERPPVRRLNAPPRTVRWHRRVVVARGVLGFGIACSIALAAYVASRPHANPIVAAAIRDGGGEGVARVVSTALCPAKFSFSYDLNGDQYYRTVDDAPPAEALLWSAAVEASKREMARRQSELDWHVPRGKAPIDVRIPAEGPAAGVPIFADDPQSIPSRAGQSDVVRGSVNQVSLRHVMVYFRIDGSNAEWSFGLPRDPEVAESVGTAIDVVLDLRRPANPNMPWITSQGDLVTGPSGTLFPTLVERVAWPTAVGMLLLAACAWPLEARLRRRRRLLESGVERPVRILAVGDDPRGFVRSIRTSLAGTLHSMRFHSMARYAAPPTHRDFSLRVGTEVRRVSRSVPSRIPISTTVGDHASVVVDPAAPWRPVFVEELLQTVRVDDRARDAVESQALD